MPLHDGLRKPGIKSSPSYYDLNPANMIVISPVEDLPSRSTVVFVGMFSHDRLRPSPTSKYIPHHNGTTSLPKLVTDK